MSKKKFVVATALALGLGFAVVPAIAANAVASIGGGVVTCGGSVPKVVVQSHATGRINHKEGVTVLNSWNNGSTYQYRFSQTTLHSVPSWETYITGIGGDVDYGNALCYGP